ncbi:MAG: amino-acid N-acetyltransferase [Verrucomicrobiales bacterium]|nr:amino-acid N-acetyltransferase [Verrucomicrobiales bacterium]
MNFEDLRAILQYVPQFRGATFVVALDGAVIESPDFSNILLDLAVLRSLNIDVVLVHGAAAQIEALGAKRKVALSNCDGTGVTDEATLEISMDAISRLSHSIMQSLTTVKIRAASTNAIQARPAGIIGGVDARFTGTLDRVDGAMLRSFLDQNILPVVQPLGFDADGRTLRVNSDTVAREIAVALEAAKIIFISLRNPVNTGDFESRQWSSEDAQKILESESGKELPIGFVSKVKQAIRATRDGVPRVHLIGVDRNDALLAELFSNEGVGLMVYADAYHEVRLATPSDADEIYSLIRRAVEDEQLIERPRSEIIANIKDYLVLAIDGNVVGCVAVHLYEEEKVAELACLFVKKGHNGMGYGGILVEAARKQAEKLNASRLFALSTQAAGYLEKAGFEKVDDLSLLPAKRLDQWKGNSRNAVLLVHREY